MSLALFAQGQPPFNPQDLDRAFGDFMFYMKVMGAVSFVIGIFFIICMWSLFAKANRPGWASIVPIYNTIVLLDIAGKPWWWLFLLIIPFVNIVILILVMVGLANNFGKGTGFALGLLFLGFIFFPILAFGSSQYIGDDANDGGSRRRRSRDDDDDEEDDRPRRRPSRNDDDDDDDRPRRRSSRD
jgi:hypothetical protein